jgi:hypothetical protein
VRAGFPPLCKPSGGAGLHEFARTNCSQATSTGTVVPASALSRVGIRPEDRAMRWDDFRASENVENRRGMGMGGAGGLGIGK